MVVVEAPPCGNAAEGDARKLGEPGDDVWAKDAREVRAAAMGNKDEVANVVAPYVDIYAPPAGLPPGLAGLPGLAMLLGLATLPGLPICEEAIRRVAAAMAAAVGLVWRTIGGDPPASPAPRCAAHPERTPVDGSLPTPLKEAAVSSPPAPPAERYDCDGEKSGDDRSQVWGGATSSTVACRLWLYAEPGNTLGCCCCCCCCCCC